MIWFRLFLLACLLSILIYTGITIATYGWNLLPVFFGDVAAMGWPGQFNLDFFTFLLLSGLWVAWRNDFTLGGYSLGVIAVFGGMLFLSIYLLTLSYRHQGQISEIVLGTSRARAAFANARR